VQEAQPEDWIVQEEGQKVLLEDLLRRRGTEAVTHIATIGAASAFTLAAAAFALAAVTRPSVAEPTATVAAVAVAAAALALAAPTM